jgi:hypothetical protein
VALSSVQFARKAVRKELNVIDSDAQSSKAGLPSLSRNYETPRLRYCIAYWSCRSAL